MKQGFVKVAAVTPNLQVADVEYNTEKICEAIDKAYENRAKLLFFRSCVLQDIRVVICFCRIYCWRSQKKGIIKK